MEFCCVYSPQRKTKSPTPPAQPPPAPDCFRGSTGCRPVASQSRFHPQNPPGLAQTSAGMLVSSSAARFFRFYRRSPTRTTVNLFTGNRHGDSQSSFLSCGTVTLHSRHGPDGISAWLGVRAATLPPKARWFALYSKERLLLWLSNAQSLRGRFWRLEQSLREAGMILPANGPNPAWHGSCKRSFRQCGDMEQQPSTHQTP